MPFSRTIAVLLSIIGCSLSITVTVPQKFVNVSIDHTITLQCTFTTNQPTTNLLVEWTLYATSSMTPEPVYYLQSGMEVIGKRFKGRLNVLSSISTTMNASISINNMQSADAGTYTCQVHNPPDIEGKTEASIMVRVLEKPSSPYCAVHGDVATGHLVTLTCHSEKGSPPPTYTWTRVEQGISRSVLGITNTQTGVLSIKNISQFEFGTYKCNTSNAVGYSICTVSLNSELNDAVIAGAVIGALLAMVFVVLLVWFIIHHMKKQKYQAAKANTANQPQKGVSISYDAVPNQESDQNASEQA